MVAKRKADKLPRRLSIDSVSVESDGSSASSSSELKNYRGAKRKFATSRSTDGDTNSGSDEETGSEELSGDGSSGFDSDEDSGFDSDASLDEETKRTVVKKTKDLTNKKTTESPSTKKRKRGDDGGDVDYTRITKVKGKAKDEDEDEDEEGGVEGEEEEEINVLSHKEQRRLRKKQKTLAAVASSTSSTTNQPTLKHGTESTNPNLRQPKSQNPEKPRRQNSVWVGNLSYRTTPESLRAFFENADAKDVTRVHMPTKGVPGLENMKMRMKGVKSVKENRGFAYVDFSTPEAKKLAISLSEKNLDGRRLLIKDGDDFAGRPDPTPANETDPQTNPTPSTLPIAKGPTTKTAQKILKAQKQPPCPCLFLGNLGFEATEERIEEMIEGHARAVVLGRIRRKKEKVKAKKEKEKEKEKGEKVGNGEGSGDDEGDEKVDIDVGIKKIRMGTFEDSGLCKGFAFVDFKSTLHSTAALTNPANHFLDGRALVVEYASAEAARRGGYRPESKTRSMAKKIIGTRQDKTRQQGRRE